MDKIGNTKSPSPKCLICLDSKIVPVWKYLQGVYKVKEMQTCPWCKPGNIVIKLKE